ncbi:hypothetical protein Fcan01_28570 [Folsomia candida]|uniref:Uncharacterized protein n=1 Tax=Folsomia candida TaxID=158441 RepID=A0A226CVM9_FOLCA|nr:hypothetical protein Fcan01_28570 [Folsomia candida]
MTQPEVSNVTCGIWQLSVQSWLYTFKSTPRAYKRALSGVSNCNGGIWQDIQDLAWPRGVNAPFPESLAVTGSFGISQFSRSSFQVIGSELLYTFKSHRGAYNAPFPESLTVTGGIWQDIQDLAWPRGVKRALSESLAPWPRGVKRAFYGVSSCNGWHLAGHTRFKPSLLREKGDVLDFKKKAGFQVIASVLLHLQAHT